MSVFPVKGVKNICQYFRSRASGISVSFSRRG